MVLTALSGCGCGPTIQPCKTTADCRSGQVCSQNTCQTTAGPGGALPDGGMASGGGGTGSGGGAGSGGGPGPGGGMMQPVGVPLTIGDGVPPDIDTTFPAPTQGSANDAAQVVYPLDKALMPVNVFPADIQWLNGSTNDIFRVTFTKPNLKQVVYLKATAGFGNHYLPPETIWRAFVLSNIDSDGVITVDRLPSGKQTSYASAEVKVRFSRGSVAGSVYYWSVGAERILRVDDGTNVPVNFMPDPPQGCVGCHSVSPSGRYMVGVFGIPVPAGAPKGAVFDLTADLTGSPPKSLFPVDKRHMYFSTWSPDEKRLLVARAPSNVRGQDVGLGLMDPFTGNDVQSSGTPLPTSGVTMPSWSPDGTAIAAISSASEFGISFSGGDLAILPVTGADAFGPMQTLLPNSGAVSSPSLRTLTYPQWTPDSKYLVYAHTANAKSQQAGRLEMVSREGSSKVALEAASGTDMSAYEPRMSPFDSGGYFWVVYLSFRPYGNDKVGNRGARQAVSQLWVSGIKKDAKPGEDPSAVGYWMPGQAPLVASISAYWAARSCRPTTSSCTSDAECCSGTCKAAPGEELNRVCNPPPDNQCRGEGQTCGGVGDCCQSLICKVNVCIRDDGIN